VSIRKCDGYWRFHESVQINTGIRVRRVGVYAMASSADKTLMPVFSKDTIPI
jgi:hypothetical protein